MLTNQEINDFKATVMWQQTNIGNTIVNILAITGRNGNEDLLVKFKLINIFSNIIIDYFSQTPYNQNNFFTTDEMYDIIKRFNHLCNTNYNVNL